MRKAKLVASHPTPSTPEKATPTTRAPGRSHNDHDGDPDDAAHNSTALRQLPILLDIARFVLTSPGGSGGGGSEGWKETTPPKARSRALALDCLRLGLLLLLPPALSGVNDKIEDVGREAFAVASVGGRDERWEVRAAAARAAGGALRAGGQGVLEELLSSQQASFRANAASCLEGQMCVVRVEWFTGALQPVLSI